MLRGPYVTYVGFSSQLLLIHALWGAGRTQHFTQMSESLALGLAQTRDSILICQINCF